MTQNISIHWFRQDLRLSDNPAFSLAVKHKHILPIYILDDDNAGDYALGAASRLWLHHSLIALNRSLSGALSCYHGCPITILTELVARFNPKAIYWNRCYEPWQIKRDAKIKAYFKSKGIEVVSQNGSLLWEPWQIQKKDGNPYKVFTPFYQKGCLQAPLPRKPLQTPQKQSYCHDKNHALHVNELKLLVNLKWEQQLLSNWEIGESFAQKRLTHFLNEGLGYYKIGRDFPNKTYVSRLSPYLHFGEISPNQLWYDARALANDDNVDHFCSELGWREFSYNQLYYNPELPKENLQSKFDNFPWVKDEALLKAWQQGQTGIPMVDAGMRELWQTGYMHNRVRMIVGSFLVKNLRHHWHHGERWFWDTLVDADLANNSASWQWIAGCGADAAPYFRIFNPVTQSQKFDPEGFYIRRFLPEIALLPNRYLFSPWEAPKVILQEAGVVLGKTYPHPVVDLKKSRAMALSCFQSLSKVE